MGPQIVNVPVGAGLPAAAVVGDARLQAARAEGAAHVQVEAGREVAAAEPPNLKRDEGLSQLEDEDVAALHDGPCGVGRRAPAMLP